MSAAALRTPSIRALRNALAAGDMNPTSFAQQALANSNRNASHNTYLWQNAEWTRAEAERCAEIPPGDRGPLWGLPISVKDCFDLAGAPTSCGTHFYRDLRGIATRDSWLVWRLKQA